MTIAEATPVATIEKKALPADLAQPFALDIATVKGELVPVSESPDAMDLSENDPLRKQAAAAAKRLVDIPMARYDEARAAIDSAGGKMAEVASHQSDMLKGKLGPLMNKSEEGGPVAQALIQLRDQVSVLDPAGVNFTPGWLARNSWVAPAGVVVAGGVVSMVPLVGPMVGVPVMATGGALGTYAYFRGDPLHRYFNRFETGQGAINSVILSLENGKRTLGNDNKILSADQKAWRENTLLLRTQIGYLRAVDAELEARLPEVNDPDHHKFLEEEILFPLRQRTQDLLQRLSVNQQGVLISEVLIRNNRELIRGVDRALFVTVDALNIAVAAAMALANQKLVLDAVDALNTTTNALIAGTAKRLRTQGAEIQKRASSTTLDENVLKQAFIDVNAAIDDISTYRRNTLPQMAKSIIELDNSSKEAEKSIRRMESGNKASIAHDLSLDVNMDVAAGKPNGKSRR